MTNLSQKMQIKNILLILTLILNFAVKGQTGTAQVDKDIFLKNEAKEITSANIDHLDVVKVWMKGVEKPLKGRLEYFNDSTFILEEDTLSKANIEKIKVNKMGGRVFGGLMMAAGGAITGTGVYWIFESGKLPGFSSVSIFLFGTAAAVVGVPIAGIGFVICHASAKKYELDEWEFQFETKK